MLVVGLVCNVEPSFCVHGPQQGTLQSGGSSILVSGVYVVLVESAYLPEHIFDQ